MAEEKKIYYSMGEVSEMFDVNPSLIRFWEQKFDILRPHKNKKGNRLFTPKDVENLKLIYHLVKERGMTLAGAQKRIKQNPQGVERDMEVIERLMSIRTLLLEIRQELKVGTDDFALEDILEEETPVMDIHTDEETTGDVFEEQEDLHDDHQQQEIEKEIENRFMAGGDLFGWREIDPAEEISNAPMTESDLMDDSSIELFSVSDIEIEPSATTNQQSIARGLQNIMDEHPVESDYVEHLAGELFPTDVMAADSDEGIAPEDIATALEVMEAIAELEAAERQVNDGPQIVEQTLF